MPRVKRVNQCSPPVHWPPLTVLVWNHYAWFNLYEILPGFVFASIAIFVVSLLDKTPPKTVTDTFEAVEAQMQRAS